MLFFLLFMVVVAIVSALGLVTDSRDHRSDWHPTH